LIIYGSGEKATAVAPQYYKEKKKKKPERRRGEKGRRKRTIDPFSQSRRHLE